MTTTRPTTVHVIGCSKLKSATAGLLPARERYTSPLFRKALAAARHAGGAVYIASAAHGLLELDEPIAWYDDTLRDRSKRERTRWAWQVADQVAQRHRGEQLAVSLWAGAAYADPLRSALLRLGHVVRLPLQGLQVGERLAALNAAVAS